MRIRALAGPAAALSLALVLAGTAACAGADAGTGGRITVLAAASLTESFTKIGKDFEAANTGVTVVFSFGSSSALAQQIRAGAPADVYAAASPATMRQVDGAGGAVVFARNQLVIAVARGNPKRIRGLADLTAAGLKVAVCAPQVPCGAAARTALDAAGVRLTPVTLEQDVKGTLAKLKLGEVDAALVYRTDARAAAAEVDGIEFGESATAVNDYPIVALPEAPNAAGAKAFVAYVRSGPAQAVLATAGFQPP